MINCSIHISYKQVFGSREAAMVLVVSEAKAGYASLLAILEVLHSKIYSFSKRPISILCQPFPIPCLPTHYHMGSLPHLE
jgi:hypothetical protein